MICNILSLDGVYPKETEDHSGVIFRIPDETNSFTRSLTGLNNDRSFKIKKGQGILLKKFRSIRIPLKLIIGLLNEEYLYFEEALIPELTLVGKTYYTGETDTELYVTLANLTEKDVLIPFSGEIVKGAIYKISKVTKKSVTGVNIYSGWTLPSFLEKCKETSDK